MINWNDIQVEQKIAQERYQAIIQARQIDRILSQRPEQRSGILFYQRALARLGDYFIRWGNYLQQRNDPVRPQC
jgi:hypothetical protein